MAIIRKKGVPTSKTVGSIGDIYHDLDTGTKYKCTFAYRDSFGSIKTSWMKQDLVEVGPDVVEEEKSLVGKRAEVNPVDEAADIPKETVDEVLAEESSAEAPAPKRINYSKQYKKR